MLPVGPIVVVVLIAVVVAASVAWPRRRAARPGGKGQGLLEMAGPPEPGVEPAPTAPGRFSPGPATLAGDLSRWVAAGLISPEQAEAITGFERAAAAWRGPAAKGRRVSLLAEALGYVGVVLLLAGAAVGLGLSWHDLAVWARLLVPVGATVLLILGGLPLRGQEEPAFRRLQSVLWALAVGGTAWAMAVLGANVLEIDDNYTAVMTTAACAAVSASLYLLHRRGVQQVALLASLHGLVISGLLALPIDNPATPWVDNIPIWCIALSIWALGLAWAALGWRGVIRPGWLAIGLGLAGAVVGPAVGLGEYQWLLVPGLLTTVGLVASSVPTRQTPLLALGMVGVFGYITWTVVYYFSDSLGVPVALVIVGAVFLALAVLAGTLATHNRRKVEAAAG